MNPNIPIAPPPSLDSAPDLRPATSPKAPEDSNKKIKFLEKLIEVEVGFLILGVVIIAGLISLAVYVVNTKINTLDKSPQLEAQSGQNKNVVGIAGQNNLPQVYITEQSLSIDKAFNATPNQIKLTVNGQFKKEVFGYMPYWAVSKADDINIKVLTSVSYFGLDVNSKGEIVKSGDAWNTWQNDPNLVAFIRKLKKNRVKAMLTFKSFSNQDIEGLLNSPDSNRQFINNVLYQVSSKSLDGVNLDFEYSGTPSEQTRDKFSILVSNLNQALKQQYPKSILTISTYVTSGTKKDLFDIDLLSQNSDGLVIMGYDFSTPNSSLAGAVSPLGGSSQNLTSFIDAYLETVPPEKIILAVPYYGYDWQTKDRSENSAVEGDRSTVGVLPYAVIMDATRNTTINWDEDSQTPWYSYVDNSGQNHVVHFENTRSLGIKYDLVNKKKLQGVGIWALGFDGRNTDLAQLLADKFAN